MHCNINSCILTIISGFVIYLQAPPLLYSYSTRSTTAETPIFSMATEATAAGTPAGGVFPVVTGDTAAGTQTGVGERMETGLNGAATATNAEGHAPTSSTGAGSNQGGIHPPLVFFLFRVCFVSYS